MAEAAMAQPSQGDHGVWKILVVDDKPAIHQVTKLALHNQSVLGRPSPLRNALSASDARDPLDKHPETTGLEIIQHIRQQAANLRVRIILRTARHRESTSASKPPADFLV